MGFIHVLLKVYSDHITFENVTMAPGTYTDETWIELKTKILKMMMKGNPKKIYMKPSVNYRDDDTTGRIELQFIHKLHTYKYWRQNIMNHLVKYNPWFQLWLFRMHYEIPSEGKFVDDTIRTFCDGGRLTSKHTTFTGILMGDAQILWNMNLTPEIEKKLNDLINKTEKEVIWCVLRPL